MFFETRKFLPLFVGIMIGIIVISLKPRYENKVILCKNDKSRKKHADLHPKIRKQYKIQSNKAVEQTYCKLCSTIYLTNLVLTDSLECK